MLTDTRLRTLKPQNKPYKETDNNGLSVEVRTSGAKFFRYPQTKKEQVLTLGEYPALGLKQARDLRDEAKALLVQGIDPSGHRKQQKQEEQAAHHAQAIVAARLTFEALFTQWHTHNLESWSYAHAKDIRQRVEKHLLPHLGAWPVDDIKHKDMIHVLKLLEQTGALETLKRIKEYASRVFRYGVAMGLCERDPTRDLPSDIFKKQERGNFAYLTDKADLYQLLNAIEGYTGDYSTPMALRLAPHVFLRPNELAGLTWSDVDLENGLITIPAERMKMKRPHVAPLSKQSKALLEEIHQLSGGGLYVFPSPRTASRPISVMLHCIGWGLKVSRPPTVFAILPVRCSMRWGLTPIISKSSWPTNRPTKYVAPITRPNTCPNVSK